MATKTKPSTRATRKKAKGVWLTEMLTHDGAWHVVYLPPHRTKAECQAAINLEQNLSTLRPAKYIPMQSSPKEKQSGNRRTKG